MNFYNYFINHVVNRDFKPVQGQQSKIQYFIQCRLHIWGSRLILFLLCLSGFIFIGIYNGLNNHLKKLEKDPFASAIKIYGSIKSSELGILKKHLFFDTENNKFVDDNNKKKKPSYISVINGVFPFNTFNRIFIDNNEKNIKEKYEVLSVNIYCHDNNQDLADKYIENWLKESLIFDNDFYEKKNESLFDKIIISEQVYKELYKGLSKQEPIFFLTGSYDLIVNKNKLTDLEKMKYIDSMPLLNVIKKLPAGQAIVSEKYNYYHNKGFFKPCKKIKYFYIKIFENLNRKFNEQDEEHITSWIYKTFGSHNIESIISNDSEIKVVFWNKLTSKGSKKAEKCFIKMQFQELIKKYKYIQLDFKEEASSVKIEDYNEAFLYINKHHNIINNINGLIHFLKEKCGYIVEDHQVRTLGEFRKNIEKMDLIFYPTLISIYVLLLFYILVTFSLLLQTKIHLIGMIKSMGAMTKTIRFIYLKEAFKLVIWPLLFAFCVAISLIYVRFVTDNFLYQFNTNYVLIYIFSILIVSIFGAFFSVRNIASRPPSHLISYQA